MSNKRNTCDKCGHYTPSPEKAYPHDGECILAGDINTSPTPINGIRGWDSESYRAGVYVGPTFGCIHWEKKA